LHDHVARAREPCTALVQRVGADTRLDVQQPVAAERVTQSVVDVEGAQRERVDVIVRAGPIEAVNTVRADLRRRRKIELVTGPAVPLAPRLDAGTQIVTQAEPLGRHLVLQPPVAETRCTIHLELGQVWACYEATGR